ncbi:hypothetical protein UP10_35410 [Bradyrhizobium sp. LTSPM299]|nr:hypothetical protein UP10_35410 [Bradyrhizobium sp. LTSPM299]
MVPRIPYEPFQPMLFWAISIAVIVVAVSMSARRGFAYASRHRLALAGLFFTLPHIYAFGTSNNYWEQAARAGIFWLLGSFVIAVDLAGRRAAVWVELVPVAAVALLVPTVVLSAAMDHPYRQEQALRLQTTKVPVGGETSEIRLDEDAATYVRGLRSIAASNGFQANAPIIDMSGVSPAAVFIIGGRAPGAAWLNAGYSGSDEYFKSMLDLVDCNTIASSWLLVEPGSPYAHSTDLLKRYGVDVSSDYREVGRVRSVRSAFPQNAEQVLLKPVRAQADARRDCERAKELLLGRHLED